MSIYRCFRTHTLWNGRISPRARGIGWFLGHRISPCPDRVHRPSIVFAATEPQLLREIGGSFVGLRTLQEPFETASSALLSLGRGSVASGSAGKLQRQASAMVRRVRTQENGVYGVKLFMENRNKPFILLEHRMGVEPMNDDTR
jgi:hypothetical protein